MKHFQIVLLANNTIDVYADGFTVSDDGTLRVYRIVQDVKQILIVCPADKWQSMMDVTLMESALDDFRSRK